MFTYTGKSLGKYNILERLGKGGMAEVYKAYQPSLDRYVTIKILYSHLAEGKDFLARFEREAKAIASLRHPHIVQIYDYDVIDGTYFMVMEFINGGTLQACMSDIASSGGYLPVGRTLDILDQVGSALDFAHHHGVIHRDIKPSNILLDSSGNSFLSDFGISRIMSMSQFTATGMLIGTPAYMSPEQGLGTELTPASDLYSLGIIVYELLTGKVPFTAETTPLAVIHKQIYDPPPNPRALRPELPEQVEKIILKALAKNPGDRYQSACLLVQELRQALSPELTAEMDGSSPKLELPIPNRPTEVIEDLKGIDQSQLPTSVMDAATIAEITGERVSSQPDLVESSSTGITENEMVQPTPEISQPDGLISQKRIYRTLPQWVKSRWVILGGIALIIIVALVLVLSRPGSQAPCTTVETCIAQAEQARSRGDLPGYIDRIHAALDHVPPDQHPPNAVLWCELGDVEGQLNQILQARDSYQACIDWTQGIPDLQPLRDRANNAINSLP